MEKRIARYSVRITETFKAQLKTIAACEGVPTAMMIEKAVLQYAKSETHKIQKKKHIEKLQNS